jgi:hypothetical protein
LRALLQKLGSIALGMINENIRAGKSYDGELFKYSENPFFRPYDPKIAKKLGPPGDESTGALYKLMRNQDGELRMLVFGYASYKAKIYPDAANDFLTATGRMLRNMQITKINESTGSVVIGFTDPEQEQKAFWLNVSGAGRGRKLWRFLGLTKEQEMELAGIASKELEDQAALWVQTGIGKYSTR